MSETATLPGRAAAGVFLAISRTGMDWRSDPLDDLRTQVDAIIRELNHLHAAPPRECERVRLMPKRDRRTCGDRREFPRLASPVVADSSSALMSLDAWLKSREPSSEVCTAAGRST